MKYNLPVTGMKCASCVARVEKVLMKEEGLENVKVNYATEKVTFDVVDKSIDLKKAAEKLEQYGYSLQIENNHIKKDEKKIDNNNSEVFSKEYDELKNDFRLALIFTIPVFGSKKFLIKIRIFLSSWLKNFVFNKKVLIKTGKHKRAK